MNRRRWYLLLHAPLALWVAATIVVVSVHRFFEAGGWLMVHLLLLGAVSTNIHCVATMPSTTRIAPMVWAATRMPCERRAPGA